jgi:putative nucleotidyltransferase with HDIG domain
MAISEDTRTCNTELVETNSPKPWMTESAALLLERTFGVEFSAVDGTTGMPLFCSPGQPEGNWGLWSTMCQEVVRRRRPEFLQEEPPFLVLAIPLIGIGADCPVAVGIFVTRPVDPQEDLSAAATRLALDPDTAAQWATQQIPWPPEHLQRVATLVLDQLAARRQIFKLQAEAEDLSVNVASTYEEISLLHRITQNLKLSKSDEELGRVALEWMQEVLPAEAIAIQLVPVAKTGECLTQQARTEPVLLSLGQCPLDCERFSQLIEHLGLHAESRPLVRNEPAAGGPDWPFPEVRQLIVVPLAEGENLFGWLAAINHTSGAELGTVEANLLNSVGAILGIHSGNIELYRQQSELLAGIVRALTSAIDAKDQYTCGHSDRVARVAVRIATELGFDKDALNTIYLSGLLHDIGKIGVNDAVLRKPGRLTNEEYEHIKTHVEIGHKILVDLKKLDEVLPVVLHHHESWDGQGYPYRLPGSQIPLSARIVAVADSFDAMSSDRPYRRGMPDDKIDDIFRAGAGKQWDPEVVAAFFRARNDIRQIVDTPQDDIPVGLREDV